MAARAARRLALLAALLLAALGFDAVAPAAAQAPAGQQITIETPSPGTQVGSPATITGRVARLSANAALRYVVLASDGRVLGSGSFFIPGNPGEPSFFIAQVTFAEPLEGDSLTLQLLEVDVSGAVVSLADLPLVAAPVPQRISFETPAPGTRVGNPVTITGRTVRFPLSGGLGYAIYNSAGVQVGGGFFPVSGSPQEGSRFVASLAFAYPELGRPLRIDLYDQDPFTLAFLATATLELSTVALRQQITIEMPPLGTQVGSPVVITGRTARYPVGGVLYYRISDQRDAELGFGSFVVSGFSGEPARFNASIDFRAPAGAGPLRAEIYEIDANGFVSASAGVELWWGRPGGP
ncbi:MAG: hypothetical protein OHK0015_56180 [Chloroflexi bacterium OHK40]